MSRTKIQWSDMTWPVVTGCSHSGTPGCDNCYAARMAAIRLKHHPRYEGLATISGGKARWTGKINFNYDVLEQPLHWKKPRRVFVASMGDLFHPSVPDAFIIEVFVRMGEAHHHIYQLLTKRPRRMFGFISKSTWGVTPLSNVHLGVSVENQAAADERIHWLLQTPAAVHYVSVEPMLGAVDLHSISKPHQVSVQANVLDQHGYYQGLDWVICGGESGPGARPMHPNWVRSLRDQCQAAGVPFFFKQWGEWMGMDYTGARIAGDGAECFRWSGVPMPPFLPGESIGKNHRFDQGFGASRIGKKRAGHRLDGRTWQQFPVITGALT